MHSPLLAPSRYPCSAFVSAASTIAIRGTKRGPLNSLVDRDRVELRLARDVEYAIGGDGRAMRDFRQRRVFREQLFLTSDLEYMHHALAGLDIYLAVCHERRTPDVGKVIVLP